jgi:hypothetical protein
MLIEKNVVKRQGFLAFDPSLSRQIIVYYHPECDAKSGQVVSHLMPVPPTRETVILCSESPVVYDALKALFVPVLETMLFKVLLCLSRACLGKWSCFRIRFQSPRPFSPHLSRFPRRPSGSRRLGC